MIELLTVCAILGVLAAIAVPQFVIYRQTAYDGVAQGDLRNAVSAEEAYFSGKETYVSCSDTASCQSILQGYVKSDAGVRLAVEATTTTFTGTASHVKGSGKIWRFESNGGRIVFQQ